MGKRFGWTTCQETVPDTFSPSTKISDNGLRHLANMRNLCTLVLDDTRITDQGIEHLLRLNRLTSLNVLMTDISDAAMEQLAQLSELREVTVAGTRVTAKGVSAIKRALPRIRVVIEAEKLSAP